MSTFQRRQVNTLVRYLSEDRPPLIVAVTGPRQTGKTTIVRQALRRLQLVNLSSRRVAVDDPLGESRESTANLTGGPVVPGLGGQPVRDIPWLVRTWQDARQAAWESERGFVLALDEIHRVKGWSNAVKGLWDHDRETRCPLKVVILGSAPWSMLTGTNESLTGRFMPLPVTHWSLAEMAAAFDFTVDEYLFFGGYPGAAPWADRLDDWRRYFLTAIVAPTIERDIVALTRVDKPALMRRLVDLAPHYSGQILSFSKMVGQLQDAGNTTTLAAHLDLLADAGLVAGLQKYAARAHLGKASSPKLNVLNTAVMTAMSGYTFEEARADRTFWGRIVESAVGAHLYNTRTEAMGLYYWRDRSHEVDFVLGRGPHVLGIEVKSGARFAPRRGREEFLRRFPGARTCLVGGTEGLPLNEFLTEPASFWLEEE